MTALVYSPPMLAGFSLLGALVGYFSGLFGVGGGFMLTPLLFTLFHVPVPIAVGSGLAQMIAVGIGGAYGHAAKGYVDARLAGYIIPGSVAGNFIGVALVGWLDRLGAASLLGKNITVVDLVISLLFIGLLIGIAIHMWREKPQQDEACPVKAGRWCWSNGPWRVRLDHCGIGSCSLVTLLASGLLIGVMSGLLGIGGGVILIPLLVYGFGVPLRMAIGTSSLLILASATVGTSLHALAGHVDLWLVIFLIIGSTLGVQLGAWHSHRLKVSHLHYAFAVLLLLVAAMTLAHLLV